MTRHRFILILGLVLAVGLGFAGARASVHQNTRSMTKDEILSLLKGSGPRRVSQEDIADDVIRRGIDFSPDDKTVEEFRQAGARAFLLDAIKHAVEEAARPKLDVRDKNTDDASGEEADRRAEAEDLAELAKMPLIEQARYHSLDFARSELPNFIATQMVRRYEQNPRTKEWKRLDLLEIGLTYRKDKGEEYNLLRVDGQPTSQSYDNLGGSTSAGEFGAILQGIFLPESHAEFKEGSHDSLRGRDTVIYDFSVKKVNSRSQITDKSTKQSIIVGYSGSLWVDTETKMVIRIEDSSNEIPVGFPINFAEDSVDYDWVNIAGERFLLPVHAEILLGRESERHYEKNVIEFRGYRKYEGTVKVVPN